MERIQTTAIIKDLAKKMVLITGPRQVGKTYIAREVAKAFANPVYLNYDHLEDKQIIQKQSWLESVDLVVLDELHKMPDWKNYLKGLYDTRSEHLHILVTGSARLDIFNHLGDSLAGRYFLHRLLPISPAELHQLGMPINLDDLINKSGFPEPYLTDDIIEANRWRQQYSNSLLATDVFDFDKIQNIRALRTVFELLRTKVGSPVSYQSLAEDAAISPATVKKYIEVLEAVYVIFRVTPFSKNIARSLLKEPKIYFFDTGLVSGDAGAKLENLTAVCLLKHVYGKIDYQAENYALHYLRTKDGHEVDFALVKDNRLEQIIEVKNRDDEIMRSLHWYVKQLGCPATQIVKELRQEKIVNQINVVKILNFLSMLYL